VLPSTPDEIIEEEVPAWVPTDAKIHIDLVGGSPQGRAWVEGTGEVAVETLLGADPNTDSAWGATDYDPGNLIVDGYAAATPIALIGVALIKVLDNATLVIRTAVADDVSISLAWVSEDGNDALEVDLGIGVPNVRAYSWNGTLDSIISDAVNGDVGELNGAAVTITATRLDIAVNGSAAIAGTVSSTDRPPGNPLVAMLVDANASSPVQSITLYDPLPDTTGLSELSEVS
jgi:hypothetical protein